MCLHKLLTRVDGRDWQLPKKDVRVRVDSFVYKYISISHTGLWPASGHVPVSLSR